MARICKQCRQPVAPVDECICEEDEPGSLVPLNPDPPAGYDGPVHDADGEDAA